MQTKKEKKLVEDEKIIHEAKRGKGVVKGNDTLATYKHKCPKCGYGKAEILDLGAQYSDENELVMLRCGKCGYTERLDKKVG